MARDSVVRTWQESSVSGSDVVPYITRGFHGSSVSSASRRDLFVMHKFEEPLAPWLSGDPASLAFVSAIVLLSVAGLLSSMKLLQGMVRFRTLRADDYAIVLSMVGSTPEITLAKR